MTAVARAAACATLARVADASAAVGLVLLAVDPATGLSRGPLIGGLLAALLSAPHLLGPVVAQALDRGRRPGRVLAAFFTAYAAALALAALTTGRAPLAVPLLAATAAGLCGPLLTGGLSSQLTTWMTGTSAPGGGARWVAGLDSATYGAGGILGPVAVTACAGLGGARVAVLAVAGCALVAAVLAVGMPAARTGGDSAGTGMRLRAVLAAMWRSVPLRRTTIGTCLTETAGGALPVTAALLAAGLGHPARDVGVLVTAFGAGALAGSLLVSARPPRGDPARLIPWSAAVIAAAYTGAALTPGYPLALACLAVAGLADGPLLAATLAVRNRHAPPAARARVFVTGAGLKIGAASLGAALAGVAAPLGARTVLLLCAAVTAAGAAATRGMPRT